LRAPEFIDNRPVYGLYLVISGKGGLTVRIAIKIKPISYLKAHAAEIVRNMGQQAEPIVITQNGEAKAVIQDIVSYEKTLQTMALLKILALGMRQIETGRIESAADVLKRIRGGS
jgi:prevent-host-death family protein